MNDLNLPSFLFTHPLGNPNSSHAARALLNAGKLKEIVTSFDTRQSSRIMRIASVLPQRIRKTIERRAWMPDGNYTVSARPLPECLRMFLVLSRLNSLLGIRYQHLVDEIYRKVDKLAAVRIKQSNPQAVYGYEDGSALTFEKAVRSECWKVYELPCFYYRAGNAVMDEELEQFPEFADSVDDRFEPAEKLARKDQELALADLIIVPSGVVKESLKGSGVKEESIRIIPYGSPVRSASPQRVDSKEFRVLYAGNVSMRKGVHRLLIAWDELRLPESNLTLCGQIAFPEKFISRFSHSLTFTGSVPYRELLSYYAGASIVVLPSLADAFGLVVLEAMAAGVPVIATDRCGGADVIEDKVDGFVIPAGNTEKLKETILWCHDNREEIRNMGLRARIKAEKHSWEYYESQLLETLSAAYKNSSLG